MAEKNGEKGFLDQRVIGAIQNRGERVLTQEEIDKVVEAIEEGTLYLDERVTEAIRSREEKVLTQKEIDMIVDAIQSGNFTIKE